MSTVFYRHSGKVPIAALLIVPALVFAAAAIAGAVFGYGEFLAHLIPYHKLFLIVIIVGVMGIGALMGFVTAKLMKLFHARSTPAVLILTFAGCVVSYYAAWVAWIIAYRQYFGRAMTLWVADPRILWVFLRSFCEKGTWNFGFGEPPASGLILATIWLIEVVIIFGIAFKIAGKISAEQVFCETCKKWGTSRVLMQISPMKSEALCSALTAGDFTILDAAEPSPDGESSWNNFSLEGCPDCDNLQTLTVERCTIVTENNRSKTVTKIILHRLRLTPEQTVALAHIAASLKTPETPEPAPPAEPAPQAPAS